MSESAKNERRGGVSEKREADCAEKKSHTYPTVSSSFHPQN